MLLTTGAAVLGLSAFPLGWVAAEDKQKPTILYFNRSSGWTHPVADRQGKPLAHSEKVLSELGPKHGFEVECRQDAAVLDGDLGQYDLLAFYTNGMPFSVRQMQNVLDAVAAGKPCVGFHAANDSGAGPVIEPFLAMLGGAFVSHGAQQKARMRVTSPKFPGVEGLGDGFELFEEWYAMKNFAKDMHVILMQETKGMQGDMYQRPPYPSTWARMHGKGRVYYTALGHREDVWTNPIFQQIILGGLSWALGRADTDITPNLARLMSQ
jgi:type 1 glutamine amidotransferase